MVPVQMIPCMIRSELPQRACGVELDILSAEIHRMMVVITAAARQMRKEVINTHRDMVLSRRDGLASLGRGIVGRGQQPMMMMQKIR